MVIVLVFLSIFFLPIFITLYIDVSLLEGIFWGKIYLFKIFRINFKLFTYNEGLYYQIFKFKPRKVNIFIDSKKTKVKTKLPIFFHKKLNAKLSIGTLNHGVNALLGCVISIILPRIKQIKEIKTNFEYCARFDKLICNARIKLDLTTSIISIGLSRISKIICKGVKKYANQ